MKQKIIAAIFGLMVMANAAIPNITSANSYCQWWVEMDEFIGNVGETVGLSKSNVRYLMDEGYSPRDIATAGILVLDNAAKERASVTNNKGSLYAVTQILVMKNKDNSWNDVSKSLNIPAENFKHDMEKVDKLIRKEPKL
ncbi:MAG: hypothetical protein H6Q73_17 [Firmicutes bacterium]|nr:hypothetical protein [Bacillota bacterium]